MGSKTAPPQLPEALTPIKGRGAVSRSSGRFESLAREVFDDGWGTVDEEPEPLTTTLTRDTSRSIIARNRSPDIPFDRSINPYRGCEHGCIYCYARPTHAYLGCSPGLEFESKLFYKPEAAELLRSELNRPSYRCDTIALGTNTDPYQPVERKLCIMREILEVLAEYSHPVSIVTKSALVERDIDILGPMAERGLASVAVSVTTLDRSLARKMEPRAAAPDRRIQAIRAVSEAGVPVTVMVAPVIPYLTDSELETILARAAGAGATSAGYILVRLPLEIKDLFQQWLETHYPLKADRILNRIRDTRGGNLYESEFGQRMRGRGVYAELIAKRFRQSVQRLGLGRRVTLDPTQFKPPVTGPEQLGLI